jgi:hypothetical protein
VPSAEELAAFLLATGRTLVPFKATAGLHHPHPRIQGDRVAEHGFLRVCAAAALVVEAASRARRTGVALGVPDHGHPGYAPPGDGLDLEALVTVLSAAEPSAAVLGPDGLRLPDRLLDPSLLAAMRRGGFLSIGSCSIDEPVEDLAALGVLTPEGGLA